MCTNSCMQFKRVLTWQAVLTWCLGSQKDVLLLTQAGKLSAQLHQTVSQEVHFFAVIVCPCLGKLPLCLVYLCTNPVYVLLRCLQLTVTCHPATESGLSPTAYGVKAAENSDEQQNEGPLKLGWKVKL